MVEGSITDITEKGPVTSWSWGYYAADFIKENGQMRLWHVLRVEDVDVYKRQAQLHLWTVLSDAGPV